jgi:CheY-like chemotaxis protein
VPKILVADDNTNIQKMVSLAFEERGIDVVSVGNGEAAVRRIPDMNPDLVLADIFMPVRNGYEVCEFVKKDGRFSHVPVILLVGAFDPLDEKEARRVGADGVLKKPFVPPDPLIAMVISALEKNPKVAAEMAKAKEVVPEPEPMPPALEAPARAEVKPLPDFPEPSPEEAALVYGFGSGKRGKEDAAEDKGPVAADIQGEETDEEDAEGSSTHDWRRNAMDFEIPEETSKTTAFALDDEPAAAMFPSEKEVPPKHVSIKKASKDFEAESATQIAPAASAIPPVVPSVARPAAPVSPAAPAPAAVVEQPAEPHDSFLTATMLGSDSVVPVVAPPISASAPVDQPVAKALPESSVKHPSPIESTSVISSIAAPADKASETPALEIEQAPEPTFMARATHWMDAMTAAFKDPEPDEQDWTEPAPPVKMDLDAKKLSPAPAAKVQVEAPEATPAPAVEAQTVVAASAAPSGLSEELPLSTDPVEPEKDDAFFVDEESAAPQWIPVIAAETKKPAVAPNDPALETSAPVPVSHLAPDPELVAEPEDAAPVEKDPALVVPPSVHVTPEPLLVDDTPAPTASSKYDKREEPIPPAFAFTEAPQAEAHIEPEPEKDERIPTVPPPNREVLAEIPFLSPPKEFLAATAEENKNEDTNVDDVVRKVLEKLEPQLHDLLSQGLLKPLVENIIQNDLAKKGR